MFRVTVSSVQQDNPEFNPFNVLYPDRARRWASAWSDPQWIVIDFTEVREFDTIRLDWETAFGRGYDLLVSDNNYDWKIIHQQEQGVGGLEIIYVGPQKARYLKLLGRKRGTSWGYSLYSMVTQTLDDQRVPEPPSGLVAGGDDQAIFLVWEPNLEKDICAYRVYRSGQEPKDFKQVGTVPQTARQFKDKEIRPGQSYFYYVTALDYVGNESAASAICAKPVAALPRSPLYPVPAAAWKHYLGDIPAKTQSSSPNRGVALGGFGTGGFMYNLSGSFGPFQTMDNVIYRGEWLEGAAFHFYERLGEEKPRVQTLSTDPVLKKAWKRLAVGDAVYHALQPQGWVSYQTFQHELAMHFFSPIIPGNYQETSYPVAVWEFQVCNRTQQASTAAIMFTFPSVFMGQILTAKKFEHAYREAGDVSALVLKASNGAGEWCLATQGPGCTYLTGWDAAGDGKDVWDDFSQQGCLRNGTLTPGQDQAAALAMTVTLTPGETKRIPFVLSWDFPVVHFGQGREWWKHYTKYFGCQADQSLAIARVALQQYPQWENAIQQWVNPILENTQCPDWLKRAALNELYYTQFGGSFYTAGLKSALREGEKLNRPEAARFFEMECMRYPYANTFDVRHYSSVIFARFWPEIEKQILLDWADAIMHVSSNGHQTPHDSGNPMADPYFLWDDYGTRYLNWKDLHSKFIQQCWRYWHWHQDRTFLEYVWPACQATFHYMKTCDTDHDGLPNNVGSDNTYDFWGLFGTSLLCGGLWVGALEALKAMAGILQDAVLPDVESWLSRARPNLEQKLWMRDSGYYRIDTDSEFPTAIMADGLNGQRYCETCGLPDILLPERMRSHLQQVYLRCVKPLHDFTGGGVGTCGALNGVRQDGRYIGRGQSEEVWGGSSYFLAASMYRAGLTKEALDTAFGVYYLTYEEESTAYWFNAPEAWHDKGLHPRPDDPEQYQRLRAVWELLLEVCGLLPGMQTHL